MDIPKKEAPAPGTVEVVLFDYGQVLSTPPDPAVWARMQAIAGLNDDKLHETYWALRHDYDRGALLGPEYWHALAKRAETAFDEAQVQALLAADVELWAKPNPPIIAWAARLQRVGVRTAILSNIGDAMAEGLTARLTWLQSFERCIWSYALRIAKPEPDIFRITAELLRVDPERVLFVDDKEENVVSAEAIGIQAIQYTGQIEFEQAMRGRGLARLWEIDHGAIR